MASGTRAFAVSYRDPPLFASATAVVKFSSAAASPSLDPQNHLIPIALLIPRLMRFSVSDRVG
jgi:hypothetical protein